MKRTMGILLVLILSLTLCACGKKSGTSWQEQYDLGVRYLSEGNYEEAVIAFTAAIEIDAKRPEAYLGRGDAYEKMGDLERATADYLAALELDPNADTEAKLNALEAAQLAARLQEALWPAVCDLVLPMTVDSVVLGETDIETAKTIYSAYPYAMSNLMNDDTEDTVYNCFGMNDMPIPTGHSEMEFGFIFAAPVGGSVDYINLNQPGLTAFGSFQAGDRSESVLEFFGFPETPPRTSIQWTLNNGAQLSYNWYGNDLDGNTGFEFIYLLDGQRADIRVENGVIYSLTLSMERM